MHHEWAQLKLMNRQSLRKAVSKVAFVKRCEDGQLYIAAGFRKLLHFTVGNKGKVAALEFSQSVNIQCHILRGFTDDVNIPKLFHVSSMPGKGNNDVSSMQVELHSKVRAVGKAFMPHLMKVSFCCNFHSS